ncbi:MAG: hypothetical protein ABSE62_04855 [Chthoniobacteraceae bacterium]|jgi:hypothetical protein
MPEKPIQIIPGPVVGAKIETLTKLMRKSKAKFCFDAVAFIVPLFEKGFIIEINGKLKFAKMPTKKDLESLHSA